ncbi:hypothetical protein NP233_g1696 [Leucocoprinus birnbaumii]|uniref:Small ribosomal subunit protein uS7 domain-containing protein n=1 Tax=Leucocoprinus birnbaumii TaxID=56174 RepID=A0AAD5W0F0_9AGAR|nr:hypothetical protein NP233_g1696 [Leucocoprinus birnbaumii]
MEEIPKLYPLDIGTSGHGHYFIEYRHPKWVERALRLRLGSKEGLFVYTVEGNSRLLDQFRSCNVSGSSPNHVSSAARENYSPWPHQSSGRLEPQLRQGKRKDRRSSERDSGYDNVFSVPYLGKDLHRRLADRSSPTPAPRNDFTSNSAHISRKSMAPSTDAAIVPSQAPAPLYSLETLLVFEIQGQKQVFDLARDPGDDPKVIIELLKLSKSERSNWMIAGAHYRRRGNPRAGQEVVSTMIQGQASYYLSLFTVYLLYPLVMSEHGYALDSLKAAFPFLAACEYDLARLARGASDTAKHDFHSNNAKSWLQITYGKDAPTLEMSFPNPLLSSRTKPVRVSPPSPPTRDSQVRSSVRFDPIGRSNRKSRVGSDTSRPPTSQTRAGGPSKERGTSADREYSQSRKGIPGKYRRLPTLMWWAQQGQTYVQGSPWIDLKTSSQNIKMAATTLPKEISKLGQEVKLFGKWDTQDVDVKDISLADYIQVRHAVYVPHTAGRYAKKQFKKAQMPIVERLVDSLMMKGRNNGKKLMTVRIVAHAFEIIHLLTDQNPIQVLVDAIVNTGPREDSTRIGSQGTVRRQAVDVSPLRRVNQAISLLTVGTRESAFRNVKSIAECLADELINAAKGSSNSYAIKKKDELERVAKSNR